MSRVCVWGRMMVPSDKAEEVREVIENLVVKVGESDPGTIAFGFFEDPETPNRYMAIEVYESPEAQLEHLGNVGLILAELGGLGLTMESLVMTGNPTTEARAVFDQNGAQYWPVLSEILPTTDG